MESVHPYLFFNGNAREAIGFYSDVFGVEPFGIVDFAAFADQEMELSEEDLGKVAHSSIPLTDDVTLMLSDVAGEYVDRYAVGSNAYVYLEVESEEEADRLFAALSDGGSVEMPLMETEWADKYGSLVDKYGQGWMVGYTGDAEFDYDEMDDEDEA